MTASTRRGVRASRLLGGMALLEAALWLSSYRWYTTAGFDFERPWGGGRITRYDRVRWDAGSFWVGRAEQVGGPRAAPMDWWDPGGTLFARSIPPVPRTAWNRRGWWLVPDAARDPYIPARYVAVNSQWVGVPGWVPAALLGGWPVARWRVSVFCVVDGWGISSWRTPRTPPIDRRRP